MGMYTEIYVNVDLVEDVPEEVLEVLKVMCGDSDKGLPKEYPDRWECLFSNMSYYTPNTKVSNLTFDDISNQWSLIGKGDIKNYDNEIEQFFEWIAPWCENDFIGYHRYEEQLVPTLVYRKELSELENEW